MGRRWLIFAALVIPLLLAAQPVKQLKPTGYVNDFAGVLDSATTKQLTSLCEDIDHDAKAQIAVVTVNTLDGADIESYAVDLFKQWGIGGKQSNRGVLVLLAVQERRYRIEVGYGLEPILPDGKVGGFGREAVPLLQKDNLSGAVQLMTLRIAETIAGDAGILVRPESLPESPEPQRPSPPPPSDSFPIFLIGGALVVLLIILGIAGAIGGWGAVFNVLFFILNIFLSGGRSGRSSDGFGGGGGFGGFGGGSSGGGGASGRW